MEIYLLKSTLCLALFFVFYKMVLENTSIHHFKRFYLLGSLLTAFLIPLITFTTYAEPSSIVPSYTTGTGQAIFTETEKTINSWPVVLWTIYTLGVLFFSVKFIRNIHILIRKISQNAKNRKNNFTYVLLRESVIPHTFFSYIFSNKKQFENGQIPLEVILHEEAHARQRHSLDIILIEILKIIFWFNPLFYFLKRSIKLNHEFLADQAVLRNGIETSAYQKLLLTFSNAESYQDISTPSLAHSINYSSMKKRFTIMKTNTSRRAILFRSLLILPLLSFLIYGFTTTEIVERHVNSGYISPNDTIEDIQIKIDENSKISLNGNPVPLSSLKDELNKMNTHLSVEEKQKYLNATIEIEDESFLDLVSKISDILYDSNLRSWQTSNLKGKRNDGIKHISNKNPMAGKTVEEAEILHQQYLIELEEFKKANANRDAKEDENNPWSFQVTESTKNDKTTEKKPKSPMVLIKSDSTYIFKNGTIQDIQIKIDENSKISLNGNPVALSSLKDELNKMNTHLSVEQKRKYLSAHIEIENESLINLAEEVGVILRTNNISTWSTIILENQRYADLKDVQIKNQMASKTAEEAEVLHQQYLKDLEEFKKANANMDVKENKNNPWSIQVQERTTNSSITLYYYEDKLIPSSKAHKLLSENDALKIHVSKTEDGQRIVTISEKPVLEKE